MQRYAACQQLPQQASQSACRAIIFLPGNWYSMRLSEVAETRIRTRGGNISNRLKAAFTALRIALPKPMPGIEPPAAADVHSVIDWERLEAQYRRNPAFVDR